MEELQQNRERPRKPPVKDPEAVLQLESLQLPARISFVHWQARLTARKAQLSAALADADKRIADLAK